MNTDEFFEKADEIMLKGTSSMMAFGDIDEHTEISNDFDLSELDDDENVDVPAEDNMQQEDDFDLSELDDFSDDSKENDNPQETLVGSVSDTTSDELSAQPLQVLHSVSIPIHEQSGKRANIVDSLDTEMAGFLRSHGFPLVDDVPIVQQWKKAFNSDANSSSKCYAEYLSVRYGLFFSDDMAMKGAISLGMSFIRQLKFEGRICTNSDIRFLAEVWEEPWYDPEIISRYAIDTNFIPQLLEVMKSDLVDRILLDRYQPDEVALMCYLRLLLANKFDQGDFEKAIHADTVEEYTTARLQSDKDRFAPIRGRSDADYIISAINALEVSGYIVHDDVFTKYQNAYYLGTIIHADAIGFLNTQFADAYLVKPLGKSEFIAKIYEDEEVDLSLATDKFDFFDAKIKTDLRDLGLSDLNFDNSKFTKAFQSLICSRYGADLSTVDYKRFLAIASFADGQRVLQRLEDNFSLIKSFNLFCLEGLFTDLCVEKPYGVTDVIGENILFIRKSEKKKKKYYLQLDDYLINRSAFLELVRDARFISVLPNNNGIAISNAVISIADLNKFRSVFSGSITTWAQGKVDSIAVGHSLTDNPIAKSNLLLAMSTLNERLYYDAEQTGEPVQKINSSVKQFLSLDLKTYYDYDKLFGFMSNNSLYLGLMLSNNAYDLIRLLNNAFNYDNDSKRMYMFLFCIFSKFFHSKFKLESTKIDSLLDTPNMDIRGLMRNAVSFSFRKVIDSIDNIITIAENSNCITLRIMDGSISLSFV